MIKIVGFLVFLLVFILLFYGLNKAVTGALAYPNAKRYLHARLIMVSFVVSIFLANTYSSSFAMIVIDKIINSPTLTRLINFLIPNRAFELIYILLCMIGLNLMFTLIYIAVIAIVKLIFSKRQYYILFNELNNKQKVFGIHWKLINKFYGSDNSPELEDKYHSLGLWLNGMRFATIAIWLVETCVIYFSVIWGKEAWNTTVLNIVKNFYLLPIAAFFVIEQLQMFFDYDDTVAYTELHSIDIKEEALGSVNSLISCYDDTLGQTGAILVAEQASSTSYDETLGIDSNDTGNEQEKNCKEPAILAILSSQLSESDVKKADDYMNAIISLLNGEAICVRDNAEGEFTTYYSIYINYYLSLGKNALVLCPDTVTVNNVRKEIEAKNKRIKGLGMFWHISGINDLYSQKNTNVLVCTYDEFITSNFEAIAEGFLDDVFAVVLPDCSSLMTLDGITVKFVFGKLKTCSSLERYIFITDTESDTLKNKIKGFLPTHMNIVSYNNDSRDENTGVIIWKGESHYKLQSLLNLGDNQSTYLGVSYPLALLALYYEFPLVNIVATSGSGDNFYAESAVTANKAGIENMFGSSSSGTDISNRIRRTSSAATEVSDEKVLIVYDYDFNLFKALWRWYKYAGTKETLLQIITPFYMLREFFAANYKKYLNDTSAFSSIISDATVLKRSQLAMILAELSNRDMAEEEILLMSKKYGWDYIDVTKLLSDAISVVRDSSTVYNVFNYIKLYYDRQFIQNPVGIQKKRMVRFSVNDITSELMYDLRKVKFSVNDGEIVDLPILVGNVKNYYLRNQVICYDSRYYQITSISDDGVVFASLVQPTSVYDYYQIADYRIERMRLVDPCTDETALDYNFYEADISKNIYGYISSEKGNDFSKEAGLQQISGWNEIIQDYKDSVPVLEIKLKKSMVSKYSGSNVPERVATLLSVLLNGMFKTLFPETYQNIVAVADVDVDPAYRDSVMNNIDVAASDIARIAIPSMSDASTRRNNDSISIYVIEYSCIEYGMVASVYRNINSILTIAYKYLSWYLESNKSDDENIIRGSYLHFGSDRVLDIFAADELLSMLGSILGLNEVATIEPRTYRFSEDGPKALNRCSFCGKHFIFGFELIGDDRWMCSHCHDHLKTQEEEINSLFLGTMKNMEKDFHFTFNKDIIVRFQSAANIRKAAGGVTGGRVVGFYQNSTRQLWIEAKGPAVTMISTIAHELTHAWQHDNLPLRQLADKFKKEPEKYKMIIEGHAVFVELDFMRRSGEKSYAQSLAEETLRRGSGDEYREGYIIFNEYITTLRNLKGNIDPFTAMKELVNSLIKGEEVVTWPSKSES